MCDGPIIRHPTHEPSIFLPGNLLKRAATMLGKEWGPIPCCCVLDFDGELSPVARESFDARLHPSWPCFHTSLLHVTVDGFEMGLIADTVGAPFAVLIAEQLIASGCRHIVGYSSAGAVSDGLRLPCLVVPDHQTGPYRIDKHTGSCARNSPGARTASASAPFSPWARCRRARPARALDCCGRPQKFPPPLCPSFSSFTHRSTSVAG